MEETQMSQLFRCAPSDRESSSDEFPMQNGSNCRKMDNRRNRRWEFRVDAQGDRRTESEGCQGSEANADCSAR